MNTQCQQDRQFMYMYPHTYLTESQQQRLLRFLSNLSSLFPWPRRDGLYHEVSWPATPQSNACPNLLFVLGWVGVAAPVLASRAFGRTPFLSPAHEVNKPMLEQSDQSTAQLIASLACWLCVVITASATRPQPNLFDDHIRPLLKERCFACHGALRQEANLRVDTVIALSAGGDSIWLAGAGVKKGSFTAKPMNSDTTHYAVDIMLPIYT